MVIKDPATGKMKTQEFEVEGPIAYLETTTERQINHENATRCFEIYLDETEEQTQRIHQRQRLARSLERLKRADKQKILERHHNAQRLLEPVKVVIPYVDLLSFPSQWLRTRRDHERFLCLIEASAFLHQHQRTRKEYGEVPYIEATLEGLSSGLRAGQGRAQGYLARTLHSGQRASRTGQGLRVQLHQETTKRKNSVATEAPSRTLWRSFSTWNTWW